ncbi:MAG: hypothetical protein LQ343_003512 [Gyalolechia ehrenbergii]|nr:MAG: hypothetical protein LQ343_003512 [Gyalolechia ehrenbergii]
MPFAHILNISISRRSSTGKGEHTGYCNLLREHSDHCRYVQMLERQQAQLIAGIQGLHQMNQTGERVPVEPLEANRIGQPLVHQILQKLGVLDAGDPWDEIEPDICKSESPSAEADAAFDPPVLPETQCVWPSVMNAGDFNSCRPKAASSTSSHGWGIPLAGNARLGPGTTTRSYQFLSVEDSQSWKPNLPLATDVADGRIVDKLRFGPNAMTETRMEYFTQPFSNCLVADPDSFSYSTMGQCASSNSGRPFVGKNVTGLDDGSTGQFSFM